MEKRKIDIVFVIDGTGSMGPCLEKVKNAARTFYQRFNEEMVLMGSEVTSLRVKNIIFRDYKDDGDLAMVESDFFELPTDDTEFENDLASIPATGGGDIPENGLEALHFAFNSDFNTPGPKDRQVIVLFSDADCLDLGERRDCPNYPADMVDMDGLINEWIMPDSVARDQSCKLNKRGKRLLVYAPNSSKYKDFVADLPGAHFIPVELSTGLYEFNFDDIIKIIAASASSQS